MNIPSLLGYYPTLHGCSGCWVLGAANLQSHLTPSSLFPIHLWFRIPEISCPQPIILLAFCLARSLDLKSTRCHFIQIVFGPYLYRKCSSSIFCNELYSPSTPTPELITPLNNVKFQTLWWQALCEFYSLLYSWWQIQTYVNSL